jgi:hypothetical protein
MGLQAGDSAEDSDTWYRLVTVPDHFKSDGTLHNKAFTGRAFQAPAPGKPWDFELSGRLLSLTTTAKEDCEAYCTRNGMPRYAGVMYQKVEALRSEQAAHFAQTDVVFTPKPDDPVHADFRLSNTGATDIQAVREWLQKFIQTLPREKIDSIERLRATP